MSDEKSKVLPQGWQLDKVEPFEVDPDAFQKVNAGVNGTYDKPQLPLAGPRKPEAPQNKL